MPGQQSIGDYQILRDVSTSSRYKTLAAKKDGKLFDLTSVNRESLLFQVKKKLHDEDNELSEPEIEKLAQKKIELDVEELHQIYELAKGFAHPIFPKIYGWVPDAQTGEFYLVTEPILAVENNIFMGTRGMMPLQMISIFMPILSGIGYLHKKGFLHGNLKSKIVRIDMEDPPVVKLASFGHMVPVDGDKQGLKGTG